MASMPTYHVSKGPFRLLDEQFGGTNFMAAYDEVLSDTESGPGLGSGGASETLDQLAVNRVTRDADPANRSAPAKRLTSAQRDHFVNDWLGRWWPDLAVADTLRLGVIEAIICAKAANDGRGLPIEFYWVCIEQALFQVYFSEGEHQVTVLILTPSPPAEYDSGALTVEEDLWVVKRWDQADDDYSTVNGTPAGTVPLPTTIAERTTSGPPGKMIKRQIWRA
jgi:hypothetical protein